VTEQKEGILQSNENPASLLWAHQLKREHGYLLVRLSKVETEHGTFDERIRTAERVTESVKTSVEELSRLVKDNEEADDARLEWATKSLDVQRRMLADIERIETSQAKTPQLEAKVYGLQNQLQQALSDHRSILQKLRALEAEMQARKGEMESLAHKNGLSDTRLLMLRLDALELNRKDNERRTEQMQSKIASLEEQCQAANARNTELESRLEALSTGSGHAGLSMGSPTQVLEASNSLYTQPLPDSHTEFPSQVTDTLNTALTQMTQSEIPTQVVDPSQSPHLELPASPAVNADQG
jgi:chromosome segregation ATPase